MKILSWHWYLFLVIVGAAGTAVEIAGLRFLAPLFGTSLPIWGSAIATVIAGLALGYFWGGKWAQRKILPLQVFQLAALAAGVFLFMPAAYTLAKIVSVTEALPLAFGILFIPSVILGAVNPLAVQVEADRLKKSAGQVAGKISALTTIGSLAGILLPAFLTIPFLGSRETVWIFSGTVLLVSLPFTLSKQSASKGAFFNLLLFAFLSALTSLIPTPSSPNTLLVTETPYQHVVVKAEGDGRALIFDANLGIQSRFTPNTYTDGYWDYLAALPTLFPEKNSLRVLILGAAGSSTEHQLKKFWKGFKDFEMTSVEIDEALFPIADTYFEAPNRAKVASDARIFVTHDTQQYDIIIVDTYTRELTIPFHLASKEFFETLKPRLAEGGILAINSNANSLETLWIRSLARTVGSVFPVVQAASIPHSCNHLLLASEVPHETIVSKHIPSAVSPLLPPLLNPKIPNPNGFLLTDNRAPTDWLGLSALITNPQNNSCSA